MSLLIVTPPQSEPLTRAEAKLQTRVTHAHEDDLFDALIVTAREWVEQRTWRQLITATLQLRMDRFPVARGNSGREILLPRPRLVSVTSIQYLSGGSWATLDADRYEVDTTSEPGRVRIDDTGWPDIDDALGAVRMQFVAGYGSAADVPGPLKSAMRLLISGLYNFRDQLPDKTEESAGNLIAGYCLRHLGEIPYLVGTNEALSQLEAEA